MIVIEETDDYTLYASDVDYGTNLAWWDPLLTYVGALDEETGKADPWEEMKARVFSGGRAKDSDDILYYQGVNASKAGFGIGMGLDYEDFTKN